MSVNTYTLELLGDNSLSDIQNSIKLSLSLITQSEIDESHTIGSDYVLDFLSSDGDDYVYINNTTPSIDSYNYIIFLGSSDELLGYLKLNEIIYVQGILSYELTIGFNYTYDTIDVEISNNVSYETKGINADWIEQEESNSWSKMYSTSFTQSRLRKINRESSFSNNIIESELSSKTLKSSSGFYREGKSYTSYRLPLTIVPNPNLTSHCLAKDDGLYYMFFFNPTSGEYFKYAIDNERTVTVGSTDTISLDSGETLEFFTNRSAVTSKKIVNLSDLSSVEYDNTTTKFYKLEGRVSDELVSYNLSLDNFKDYLHNKFYYEGVDDNSILEGGRFKIGEYEMISDYFKSVTNFSGLKDQESSSPDPYSTRTLKLVSIENNLIILQELSNPDLNIILSPYYIYEFDSAKSVTSLGFGTFIIDNRIVDLLAGREFQFTWDVTDTALKEFRRNFLYDSDTAVTSPMVFGSAIYNYVGSGNYVLI